jgi:hypothetical protein
VVDECCCCSHEDRGRQYRVDGEGEGCHEDDPDGRADF